MKKLTSIIVVIALLAAAASPTFARGGTGEIRIEPHGSYYPLPIMLTSPAAFNITVSSGTSYQPNIVLIMTNASYQGLTGNVEVTWTGGSITFTPAEFEAVDSGSILANITTPGAKYMVPSLKEHIGVNETIDETLYYDYKPFLSNPLTATPQEFTIVLPSTHPRMLVYAIGKSSLTACEFDMKVPPTRAGFVVPELGAILLAIASFGGFAVYSIKQRKKLQL